MILGARAPACLEWARAFAGAGWHVTVADSLSWPLARSSRSAHAFLRLPEPRRDVNAWIKALLKAVQAEKIDLVLPTCEEVFYLAHGLDKLREVCRVFTSDFSLLNELHHKGRFPTLTKDWPVVAPETRLLESSAALLAYGKNSDEWVFKPAYSRFASQTLIRPTARALSRVAPEPGRPWVAQRFIAGKEHSSFSILVGGQLRAHACYYSRYRAGKGAGIYFEPTDPAPVRAMVEHFGKTTGYTGQVGFDFIEDTAGKFHVLECNPRATSGVHFFEGQAEALIASLGSESAEPVLTPAPGTRMVALAVLLFAAPRQAWKAEFWRDFARAKDVILRGGDHGPLTAQVLSLTEIGVRAISRRCGLLAASTADIEWDGQPLEALEP